MKARYPGHVQRSTASAARGGLRGAIGIAGQPPPQALSSRAVQEDDGVEQRQSPAVPTVSVCRQQQKSLHHDQPDAVARRS